jgi:hypothetical protein
MLFRKGHFWPCKINAQLTWIESNSDEERSITLPLKKSLILINACPWVYQVFLNSKNNEQEDKNFEQNFRSKWINEHESFP